MRFFQLLFLYIVSLYERYFLLRSAPLMIEQQEESPEIQATQSSQKDKKSVKTRVLLVTVTHNVNNTTLQHDKFYKTFSKYGEIQRILIFQKTDPWATFIEMDTVENAQKARQELNKTQILEDGTRINVLPSNKQRIELQDKNPAGIDYTILKQRIIEKKIKEETDQLANTLFQDEDENLFDSQKKSKKNIVSSKQTFSSSGQSEQSIQSSSLSEECSFLSANSSIASHQKQQQVTSADGIGINLLPFPSKGFQGSPSFCQQQNYINQTSQYQNQQPSFLQNQLQPSQFFQTNQQNFIQNLPNFQQNFQNQQSFLQNQQNFSTNQQPFLPNVNSQNNLRGQPNFLQNPQAFNQQQFPNYPNCSGNQRPQKIYQQGQGMQIQNIMQQQTNTFKQPEQDNKAQVDLTFPESLLNDLEGLNLAQSVYPLANSNNEIRQQQQQQQQNNINFPSTNNQMNLMGNNDQRQNQQQKPPSQQIQCRQPIQQNQGQQNPLNSNPPAKNAPIKTFLSQSAPNDMQSFQSNQDEEIYSDIDQNTQLQDFQHPQFSKVTKKSNVIYANRFEPNSTNIIQIFNLFSAFGNISKIIYMYSKCAVLIEYDNDTHSALAKEYLNEHVFNGNIIKIYYSHHEAIFFKEGSEKPSDEEYFEPTEQMNRFKPNTTYQINSPIDTLHISNLRRDSCSYSAIKKFFEPFGKIKNFMLMLEQNNKNMCLVKFENASIAMWALSNTHNVQFNHRQIKVSFSKRTIE